MNTKSSEAVVRPLQEPLFVDDWREAVKDIARLMGGAKQLALMIWPAKGAAAERWLHDCLNPDRAAKIDPDELKLILQLGREHGYHGLMYHFCDATAYSRPSPITPEDQRDEAMRQFSSAVKTVQDLAGRLEKLGVKVS